MDAVLKKLRYQERSRVLALAVPAEAEALIELMREAGSEMDTIGAGHSPFVIAFAKTMEDARQLAPIAAGCLDGDGLLWLCYPKGTSKRYLKPNLNRDTLWPVMEAFGMRPVSQVAIDDNWSAMRFRRDEYVGK